MTKRLDNRIVLITGAAKGIGAAAATMCVAEGAHVYMADIDDVAGRALSDALGPRANFVTLDVTKQADWDQAVATIKKTHGRLDSLVNNAAHIIIADLAQTDLESWRDVQAVNVEGTLIGCQTCLPLLKASDAGSIINLSSTTTRLGLPPMLAYTASKAAILSITKTLAVDFRYQGLNIRVNTVLPGRINTPMLQMTERLMSGVDLETDPDVDTIMAEMNIGHPEDIARAIVYLASDESAYINGTEFVVDNATTLG